MLLKVLQQISDAASLFEPIRDVAIANTELAVIIVLVVLAQLSLGVDELSEVLKGNRSIRRLVAFDSIAIAVPLYGICFRFFFDRFQLFSSRVFTFLQQSVLSLEVIYQASCGTRCDEPFSDGASRAETAIVVAAPFLNFISIGINQSPKVVPYD